MLSILDRKLLPRPHNLREKKNTLLLTGHRSIIGCVDPLPGALGVLGVEHAEVPPVPVEREHGADAVLRVDVDVPRLGQGEVEDLLEPGQALLDEEEAEHEGLVPAIGPRHLVELGHELLLALLVDDEDEGAAAGLEEADHAVVGLGAELVDLELRDDLALLIDLHA